MKRIPVLVSLVSFTAVSGASAIPSSGLGLRIGAGMASSMSCSEAGVMLPKINNRLFIDIKVR